MRTRLFACSVAAVLTITLLSSGVLRTTRGGAEVLLAQGARCG